MFVDENIFKKQRSKNYISQKKMFVLVWQDMFYIDYVENIWIRVAGFFKTGVK